MSEALYDEKIAPKLLEIAKLCEELSLPFVAAVQYGPEQTAETRFLPDSADLTMRMVSILLATHGNIDSFVINLIRYCNAHNISRESSMVLSGFGRLEVHK